MTDATAIKWCPARDKDSGEVCARSEGHWGWHKVRLRGRRLSIRWRHIGRKTFRIEFEDLRP